MNRIGIHTSWDVYVMYLREDGVDNKAQLHKTILNHKVHPVYSM